MSAFTRRAVASLHVPGLTKLPGLDPSKYSKDPMAPKPLTDAAKIKLGQDPPAGSNGRSRGDNPSLGTATDTGAGSPTPPNALKDSSDAALAAAQASLKIRRRSAAANLQASPVGPAIPARLVARRLMGY